MSILAFTFISVAPCPVPVSTPALNDVMDLNRSRCQAATDYKAKRKRRRALRLYFYYNRLDH